MRKTQVMFLVLLPQAIRAMLPTIISQLVVLLKDTALGFIITYQELLYYARYIGSQGAFGRPIVPSTIVATGIYVVMCLLLTALATYLERRNRRNKKVVAAPPAAAEDARGRLGLSHPFEAPGITPRGPCRVPGSPLASAPWVSHW